ncbi:MAG: hypothetical protein WBF33_36915 [Candidatus Nitrosopolaris sp.]
MNRMTFYALLVAVILLALKLPDDPDIFDKKCSILHGGFVVCIHYLREETLFVISHVKPGSFLPK